jgi:hypothetical protein
VKRKVAYTVLLSPRRGSGEMMNKGALPRRQFTGNVGVPGSAWSTFYCLFTTYYSPSANSSAADGGDDRNLGAVGQRGC